MKNATTLKSINTNSPKTPGGISKSLLTPCRRVGLSRNWKRNGPSPFISPLSGSTEVKVEKVDTRKRKETVLEDVDIVKTPEACSEGSQEVCPDSNTEIDKTPSRNLELPRRKKSKTFLSALNKSLVENTNTVVDSSDITKENVQVKCEEASESKCEKAENNENIEVVATPVRTKSKKNKKQSPSSKTSKETKSKQKSIQNEVENKETDSKNLEESPETTYTIKEKRPNELKKECIVVIQRKILKSVKKGEKDKPSKNNKKEKTSQALFNSDSESDEVPLIQLNKQEKSTENTSTPISSKTEQETSKNNTETSKPEKEDDDFVEKPTKTNSKPTKSPKNKLKTYKMTKTKEVNLTIQPIPSKSIQNSYDDEDDDFDNKKTILIRKTYEKLAKPSKAKSTGSITQKDIDDLRARIEAKKKLLLAQSISPDTETLRNLIKKWQKGCQDALMELLELMKTKFHDKQDIDYSEMLKTLKIPADLVGYDSENDCFVSPDDATIILGPYKNI